MTINQYSGNATRRTNTKAGDDGNGHRMDCLPHDRYDWQGNGDAPFFPPMMIGLIMAVFMIWIGIVNARAAQVPDGPVRPPAVIEMTSDEVTVAHAVITGNIRHSTAGWFEQIDALVLSDSPTPANRNILIVILSVAFALMITMVALAGRRALRQFRPPLPPR